MECVICGKTGEEVELYEGVYESRIAKICKACANFEGVPLIKKPTDEQFNSAGKPQSVRERMERLSGLAKPAISHEQSVAFRNLEKLKFPEKKQEHSDLSDNYYWILRMERRRRKLTVNQLAEKASIPVSVIEQIEKGSLPKDYETYLRKLETVLEIRLFKRTFISENIPQDPEHRKLHEAKIIDQVRRKMAGEDVVVDLTDEEEKPHEEFIQEKREKIQQILHEQPSKTFPRREQLRDVKLRDLIDMKREKEKQENAKKTSEMVGNDVEIEEF
jgi:ribosome-binding protein aMBF1 (putative translation factor)